MMRLSELTGLTVTDLGEIFGMITAIIIFSVFVGNVMSWMLKEFFEFLVALIDFLLERIGKYIADKRKNTLITKVKGIRKWTQKQKHEQLEA